MQHDGFLAASAPRALRPSDFSTEQQAGWIAASERKAVMDAALDPDAGRANEADDTEWFVAYTNPKREDAVATALRRRHFATYWPAMTVSRTQSRRRVTVLAPLLPRYLFVGLASGQSLYGLRETPGLEGMVRVAGQPVTVKAEVITALREAQADGVYDFSDEMLAAMLAAQDAEDRARRGEAVKALERGRKVRILSGPFASFTGLVEGLLPGERIMIVVDVFGRSSPFPMMLADVEPA